MIQRVAVFELRDTEGQVLAASLGAVETYLAERYKARRPGPAQARTPAAWQQPIADYCLHLAAAGATARTIDARRKALARIGRALQCPPSAVTAEQLVRWFGR